MRDYVCNREYDLPTQMREKKSGIAYMQNDKMTSLGPYCDASGLTSTSILSNQIENHGERLQNGHVIELKKFADKSKLPMNNVIEWIYCLQPALRSVKEKTLITKITRCLETNRKFVSKKKVPAFKNTHEFKEADFISRNNLKTTSPSVEFEHEIVMCINELCDSAVLLVEYDHGIVRCVVDKLCDSVVLATCTEARTESVQSCTLAENKIHICSSDEFNNAVNENYKESNTLQYDISKKQKVLSKLKRLVKVERGNLDGFKSTKGHYSIRNVNKRDAAAAKTRKRLSEAKVKLTKYEVYERKEQNNKCTIARYDYTDLENSFKKTLLQKETMIETVTAENERLKQKLKSMSSARKSVSYFKRNCQKLKSKTSSEVIHDLRKQLKEKDRDLETIKQNSEYLQSRLNDVVETRNADGSFNDDIRLCVIQLAGLEVAVEKIPQVIQVVSSQIFHREITSKDLPSSSTTQAVIDEGHFLAKTFIATKIEASNNLGLNRDGTTRKKQKILDTSVTLDSGDVMSLGFTRVAHETAKTINDVTKGHMHELSNLCVNTSSQKTSHAYIRDTLAKLSFSMADRASNEKAANRLLDEWRDEVLGECEEAERQTVKHFHCMAHVLLGFHRYACEDIKKLEKTATEESGQLGRDSLSLFKTWTSTGTAVERAIRTISDTFGPAGDYLGVRDRWEAYCFENGVKSTIGNYCDNRFNGLFQTAAEITVHAFDYTCSWKGDLATY